MSKKSGPAAPPAPDPTVVSKAQSDANIATAQEQQRLNMINTHGPQGSVTYGADPTAPGGYAQTTNLSPAEQAIYDASKRTELGATNIAYDQLGRVQSALNTPLDTSGLPALQGGQQHQQLQQTFGGGPGLQYEVPGAGQVQTSFDMGGPLKYGFDAGQQVQGQVGDDLNMQRLLGSEAVYQQAASRLDPRFDKEEQRLQQRLADQGFSANSQGYQDAQGEFGRQKTDAYNQAIYSSIGAGEDAANSMFNRQLGQGQFANQAAGQMYQQNMGQAAFNNQAAGQDYGQNLGAAQFANQAQQQQYGQNLSNMQAYNAASGQKTSEDLARLQATNAARTGNAQLDMNNAQLNNTARQQGLQEQAYLQNQPINQLTGLLSLGQVGMPQGVQYSPTQVGQTDVMGAYALNQQAQNAAYQAQMQNRSGLMGGLMSLGSAAIMASDRRLKTDVRLLRRRRDGLGVYAYRYRDDPEQVARVGVMADEVKKVRPDLVVYRRDGFMAVNYAGLDLEAA